MNLETLQKAKELEAELLESKRRLELFKKVKSFDKTFSLYDSSGNRFLATEIWKEEADFIISNRIKCYEEKISRLEHELKIL